MNETNSSPGMTFTLHPIGVVHSPYTERLATPRQPRTGADVEGSIELFPATGIEHALEDLSSFRYIWVLFWFHESTGFRPKVLPPRSLERRGLFATRSPNRPNPIGMSALELVRIEGREIFVRDLDMLEGTPVLDIKPYIAYTDAIVDAGDGWLEGAAKPLDPLPSYAVDFSELALAELAFLEAHGVALRGPVEDVLRLGPQPHAYRRIKAEGDGYVLALKEWRFAFVANERHIVVQHVKSGYRPSEIFGGANEELALHRAFVERFA